MSLNPQDFQQLFHISLVSKGASDRSMQYFKFLLKQFQSDIIDPHANAEAVAGVQNWAMAVAKDNGATGPREAISMLRGRPIPDDEWQPLSGYWTYAWPNIGNVS